MLLLHVPLAGVPSYWLTRVPGVGEVKLYSGDATYENCILSLLLYLYVLQKDYEIVGDTSHGAHHGPSRSRIFCNPLLDGLTLCIMGQFAEIENGVYSLYIK